MTTLVEEPTRTTSTATGRRRRVLVVLALVAVLAALGVARWSAARAGDVLAGTEAVSATELAARNGIDVDLIAVTAAHGLVEFRYQVVDPDKATRILHDADLAPTLVDEDSGATLRMSAPPHKHGGELRLGGTYFFLMANSHDALHRGSHVTLVMGDARVEHLEVQG